MAKYSRVLQKVLLVPNGPQMGASARGTSLKGHSIITRIMIITMIKHDNDIDDKRVRPPCALPSPPPLLPLLCLSEVIIISTHK